MGETLDLCWGPVGNGSPRVNFGDKSRSFGVKRIKFCVKNVKSPHFLAVEREDVRNQKLFSTLSLDIFLSFMRFSLGPRTMGLYKMGVLEESKEKSNKFW